MNVNKHFGEIKNRGYTLVRDVFSEGYCERVKTQARKDIELHIRPETACDVLDGSLADKSQEKVLNNIQNKSYLYMHLISAEETNSVLMKRIECLKA